MRLARLICFLLLGVSLAPGQAVINGARTQPEISSGSISNPPANSLTTYACDDAGTTKLCSKDSAGTVSMGLGGGGGGITSTYDVFANRPAAGTAGDLFKSSNSPYECRDNGSTWDCWAFGIPSTVPDNSGYSDLSGGAFDSVATTTGLLVATHNGAASVSLKGRHKAIGSDITMCFDMINSAGNFAESGLMLVETGTGKIVTFAVDQSGAVFSNAYTNRTTYSSTYSLSTGSTETGYIAGVCLQIVWEATNRVLKVQNPLNHSDWLTVHTVARNDFATTAFDAWGFYASCQNSDPIILAAWHLETN